MQAYVKWATRKPVPAQKEHSSKFFITINTNTSRMEVSEDDLQNLAQGFFDNITSYIKWLDPDKVGISHLRGSPEIEAAVETGSKLQLTHLHAMITIKHDTKIHLNQAKIKTYFENALQRKVHLDIKFVKDVTYNLRRYLSKGNKPKVNEVKSEVGELLRRAGAGRGRN